MTFSIRWILSKTSDSSLLGFLLYRVYPFLMINLLSQFCSVRAYGVRETPLNYAWLGYFMIILYFYRTVDILFSSAIDNVVHYNVYPSIYIIYSVYINVLYIQNMFGPFYLYFYYAILYDNHAIWSFVWSLCDFLTRMCFNIT